MIQIYVTDMPKEETECPFFNPNNKKCNVCNDKCCLTENPKCKHLITMKFEFEEIEL